MLSSNGGPHGAGQDGTVTGTPAGLSTGEKLVRIGTLAKIFGMPIHTLRRLADTGKLPSQRTSGGHRLFSATAVRAALASSGSGRFGPAPVTPSQPPVWTRRFALDGTLEEHLVWRDVADVLDIDEGSPAGTVLRYSLTEMLNNAIDHSGGTTVTVSVWDLPSEISFEVRDDGDGVFSHLRDGLGLADNFDAVGALSKGKQTTWPERHTGEGIFFTSKVLDVFRLAGNGIRWTVDNVRNDVAVGESEVVQGTTVSGQIDPLTTRSTRDVFLEFSEEFEFMRTRPVVKLFGLGLRFVSRSEARRLLDGLEEFTEIDVDFTGVQDVGQGFVDELLRVWPSQHPAKRINPINMNAAVEFMVRRGLR